MIKTNSHKAIIAGLLIFTLLSAGTGCKKVKEIVDEVWAGYWEGVFNLDGGWQVELEGDRATFVSEGISKLGIKAGDPFTVGMAQTGDNTWRGYVRTQGGFGFLAFGNAKIENKVLTITPDDGAPYSLSLGTKTSGGTGGTPGTNAQVLFNQKVEGKRGDKKVFKITVPAGTKQMEIKATELTTGYYYNLADMFVKKGAEPTVSLTPQYSWSADCAPVESNRADEVCNFTNPSGDYYVMLYGYNSDFTTQLIVTITK